MWYKEAQKFFNPYHDEAQDVLKHSDDYESTIKEHKKRQELVPKYSWGIPSEEAIRKLIKAGPLIEVGAGSGYWKYIADYLMKQENPENFDPEFWLATDIDPDSGNHIKKWTNIEKADSKILEKHPDRSALFVWPPYDDPMAATGLKLHNRAGGDTVAYVGESKYGCTADDEFHDLLDNYYELDDEIYIPHYNFVNDYATIWKKRKNIK